ncbi:hypothetical protein OHC33_003577 [Knufia fluminis]|uniref:DUF7099 domain-containing protein n=1 Tax=Knufia fluminis TaxID=191047 RepID=A0AAN8F232_9EURO|nr:hypothetical protein OHC33_003577 [Knufia fluminis]
MSHETLASAWSALADLQDLTAGLRDTIGNSTLRSIRSSYDPEETPRRFLEYAHELSLSFDAIRFLSKIDSKSTLLLQEDLVSAVAHFLNGLANDCVGDQAVLRDASQKLILGHAFCSAVATLRTCAWDCRPELRTVLCRHAGKLLSNAPVKDESLWLIQTLANLLVAHYGSATPLGQGTDQSKTRWKMLWESKAQRQTNIQEMVRRATDTNVASAERIVPMLDLCQLYWDTDALLVQACAGLTEQQHLARVFYVPSDDDAIRLALEVRFAIQEQFAVRNMRSSSGPDSLQTQAYVMFRPGLRQQCVSDACSCKFDPRALQLISDARSAQNSLLRSAVSAAFTDSAILNISHDIFDHIYSGYGLRLRRWSTSMNAAPRALAECPEDEAQSMPQIMPLRPRLMSSHSLDEGVGHQHLEVKPRSVSQPNIHRRYSRPPMPVTRASDRNGLPTIRMETQVEEDPASYDGFEDTYEAEAIPELDGTPSEHPQSPLSSPDLTRNESITTATTSSGPRSNVASSLQPRLASSIYEHKADESFSEPVIITERPRITSPDDFEKSYPEVAVGPVTSIQEDNMSLFSENGSMPATTRSGGRLPSQKKWNGLFKGSKKSSFATPTVRFFASGKYMIAWTRYGGTCFDVSNPDDSKVQPINAGDIVLGAGGSRRYAVVARHNEAYTLSVYNLGDLEPGFKVNLGSCPKAMEMSKDDKYLAIKYAHVVRIFDLHERKKIDHKLPKMEGTKTIPGGHLVAFAHDSQSFMASTRMGPEKVLTYWSWCMDTAKHSVVHSNAPCGNIDDHGLTTLAVAGPSVRGIPTGFLSTFTEKGVPVILSMSSQQAHAIPLRTSRDMIGTRVHSAGVHVDPHTKKSNLVLVNHNNDVFWVSDLFGRGQDIQRFKSLKRAKSMKPELLVAMPNADEASIFWIDQKLQSGMLMKVGRSGGMTRPVEIRLDLEPMCGA